MVCASLAPCDGLLVQISQNFENEKNKHWVKHVILWKKLGVIFYNNKFGMWVGLGGGRERSYFLYFQGVTHEVRGYYFATYL
jgi:hypothetical protein